MGCWYRQDHPVLKKGASVLSLKPLVVAKEQKEPLLPLFWGLCPKSDSNLDDKRSSSPSFYHFRRISDIVVFGPIAP